MAGRFGVERTSDEIYDVLNRAAEQVPDDIDGLVCQPLFRGTRRQPDARGLFSGVTPSNFTRVISHARWFAASSKGSTRFTSRRGPRGRKHSRG